MLQEKLEQLLSQELEQSSLRNLKTGGYAVDCNAKAGCAFRAGVLLTASVRERSESRRRACFRMGPLFAAVTRNVAIRLSRPGAASRPALTDPAELRLRVVIDAVSLSENPEAGQLVNTRRGISKRLFSKDQHPADAHVGISSMELIV